MSEGIHLNDVRFHAAGVAAFLNSRNTRLIKNNIEVCKLDLKM